MRLVAILTNVILAFYKEMCPRLWDLHNTGNQYFRGDQRVMLQNHLWVKGPISEQDKSMDFNGTEYEHLISIVSDFSLQQNFKKSPLAEFLHSIKKYP